MRTLLLSALLLAPDGDRPKESPLDPLCKVAAQLEKGFSGYLKGAGVHEAFKPWPIAEDPGFREALRGAGAEGIRVIGFELYISFVRKGALVYRVRAETRVSPTEASLITLGGGGQGGAELRGVSASACAGPVLPFGEAASAFARAARTGRAGEVPFASRDALVKLLPEPMREDLLRGFEYSRKDAHRIFAEIAKLEFDEVRVDAGDLYAAALDAFGSPRDGKIRADVRILGAGEAGLRLLGFKGV